MNSTSNHRDEEDVEMEDGKLSAEHSTNNPSREQSRKWKIIYWFWFGLFCRVIIYQLLVGVNLRLVQQYIIVCILTILLLKIITETNKIIKIIIIPLMAMRKLFLSKRLKKWKLGWTITSYDITTSNMIRYFLIA